VFVFRPSTLRKLGTLLFTLLVLELAEEGGARERGAETLVVESRDASRGYRLERQQVSPLTGTRGRRRVR
jgi:hypothetical protein